MASKLGYVRMDDVIAVLDEMKQRYDEKTKVAAEKNDVSGTLLANIRATTITMCEMELLGRHIAMPAGAVEADAAEEMVNDMAKQEGAE